MRTLLTKPRLLALSLALAASLIAVETSAEVFVRNFTVSQESALRAERELRDQSRYLSRIYKIDSSRIAEHAGAYDQLWGYLSSLAPQVTDEPFKVLLRFNNYVVNLERDDLISNNAHIQAIIGSGTLFSVLLVPSKYSVGDINLQLREQSVVDIVGNVNSEASNVLLRSSSNSLGESNFLAENEVDQRQVEYQPVLVQPREVSPEEFGFRVLGSSD